ncbi:UL49 protein [Gallid alphaherpesvirus 3]|uniref:Tegument protein VP22 n=2 Tax=Gallid alphaherpesvirus 3 TaxID=35250 RepID=A0A1P7U1I8_9ALPH|nr:tegument protein VP22 [Gallid alphaherpesvirus 3]YP_010795649.1 UL49 protein [Gallid alphaherpesvirus 3]BAA32585.1 tegument protein [Marek's disease virus serotype 2 MDV2]AEI00258.1 UL49 protein [Gallid alphaherpesvirus 3]QEY02273.1 UL49 protein [Gallid alphaherpesvirus 3]BAA82945.1 UL49 product homolog [Marek's disease virus serotype 2 MDV2]BAB16559.1 UL49 protein [Gallid alphaherpesvirus 3]
MGDSDRRKSSRRRSTMRTSPDNSAHISSTRARRDSSKNESPDRISPPSHSLQRRRSVKIERKDSSSETQRGESLSSKVRAKPGARAIEKGKFAFSTTPASATSTWRSNTLVYNERIFCGAVAAVAQYHAYRGALSLWRRNAPRTNAELEEFLARAIIKITIQEGANLLDEAEACTRKLSEESGLSPDMGNPKSRSQYGKRDGDESTPVDKRDRRSKTPGRAPTTSRRHYSSSRGNYSSESE